MYRLNKKGYMAGHSKWNNIKNRKGAVDAKRGKIFSQLAKQIKTAVKEGGSGDPETNPALRPILDKARAANMPKDNIQRAIDRGLGKSSRGAQLQEVTYEGYGPGGVGIVVAAVTENQNRTSSEVRTAFSRNNGSLGGPNSAAYLFERTDDGEYQATMSQDISDEQQIKQLEAIIDTLRENDDVEDVYVAANWEGKEE